MEKIIATALIALIGVMIWYLKCQTKRMNKREDKRDERDAKREDKILDIVNVSLKDMEKTVSKDSENTVAMNDSTVAMKVSVDELKEVISNHLVHNIEKLTNEISRMNGKK